MATTYAYKGLNKSGKEVAGQLAAEDERTALAQIKSLGLFPTNVKAASADSKSNASGSVRSASSRLSFGGSVGSSDLAVFSRQLANLVAGGLPLMRTFAALTEHTENLPLKSA